MQLVVQRDADDAVVRALERRDAHVGQHDRAEAARVERVLQREPLGVRGLRVVVGGRAAQAVGAQAGLAPQRLVAAEHAVALQRLVERQRVVGHHPHADQRRPALVPLVDRQQERQRVHEVRRDVQQPLALAQRLAHERHLEVLQVAQAAVHEPRRAARRAGADVALVDEQDATGRAASRRARCRRR